MPLVGFIIFINQIAYSYRKLREIGAVLPHKKWSLRSILSGTFLLFFFLLFTVELFIQSNWVSSSFLPPLLEKTLHSSIFIGSLGVLLIAFSIVSLHHTFKSFGSSFRFGLNAKELGALKTNGVFSISRNPFFVSIESQLVGIACAIPTPFFAAIALIAIVSIHFFILKEEKFLRENYGEEYQKYCKKVRRYF